MLQWQFCNFLRCFVGFITLVSGPLLYEGLGGPYLADDHSARARAAYHTWLGLADAFAVASLTSSTSFSRNLDGKWGRRSHLSLTSPSPPCRADGRGAAATRSPAFVRPDVAPWASIVPEPTFPPITSNDSCWRLLKVLLPLLKPAPCLHPY